MSVRVCINCLTLFGNLHTHLYLKGNLCMPACIHHHNIVADLSMKKKNELSIKIKKNESSTNSAFCKNAFPYFSLATRDGLCNTISQFLLCSVFLHYNMTGVSSHL